MQAQTIKQIAKELGYGERHTRTIAREMVDKGEWEEVLIPDPDAKIKAYIRKKKK